MYLFKAVVMCGQCGEIHNEKWLESKNRHTTTTVLEMLCEPCMFNELTPADVCFLCLNPWDKCDCFDDIGEDVHHSDCRCIECEHPIDFTELDNDGNPLPDFVDPFDYDDDKPFTTPGDSSCVVHKCYEDPFGGCPECDAEYKAIADLDASVAKEEE